MDSRWRSTLSSQSFTRCSEPNPRSGARYVEYSAEGVGVQGAPRLPHGPLVPAPGNRNRRWIKHRQESFLAVLGMTDQGRNDRRSQLSVKANLEVEDHARRNAQVVLILRSQAKFVEMGHQVVQLHWTNGKTVGGLEVHAASDRHGKRIIRSGKCQSVI